MIALAGIIVLGIFAQWVAWKARVPAILPLILIGLVVGPLSELWSVNGEKWIDPLDNGDGKGLFLSETMFAFISLAIGIILFEGGLTLKKKEIKDVGPVILRLISIGSVTTFIGGTIATHFLCELTWGISALFAALIIVTGPTVIAPILRNVPLNRNVSTVLKWEGILIDPIGALAAVLVFELVVAISGADHGVAHGAIGDSNYIVFVLTTFIQVNAVGFTLGLAFAFALQYLIKKSLIPHYLLNVFTLAMVLLLFALSDTVAHESGLLAVVVMGMVLANVDVPLLKEILDFKESLTVLLISILFIILSASMDLESLTALEPNVIALLFVIILFLRPLGVFLSTINSGLSLREKLFISWVGPRGIVAAGIASLFGLKLVNEGLPGAEFLAPMVFVVVLGTVLLNATTARLMANLLKVTLGKSEGVLIVGASRGARLIAKYLIAQDKHVVLIDNSAEMVKKAQKNGLEAFQGNIYNVDLGERFELLDMGYLLAMTASDEVNAFACNQYQDNMGEHGSFRLVTKEEMDDRKLENPTGTLFCSVADYLNFNEIARDWPQMNEIEMKAGMDFKAIFNQIMAQRSIPIFVKKRDNTLIVISADFESLQVEEGDILVYMGMEFGEMADDEAMLGV